MSKPRISTHRSYKSYMSYKKPSPFLIPNPNSK